MTNLLERAISTDDAHRATKIIQDALVLKATKLPTITFPKPSRRIVSNGRGSSATGEGRSAISGMTELPVALERRRSMRIRRL